VSDVNITDAIFAVAERSPHAVAIIDGENPVSFRTLCEGVRLAARCFERAGWRAGDLIGIAVAGSQAGHLLASLALARSGITQISLPVGAPAPMLRSSIRTLGISGIVSDAAPGMEPGVATVAPEAGWLAQAPDAAIPDDLRVAGGDRPWILAETSGTTGEPKLVGISHAVENEHRKSQAPIFAHLAGERYANLSGVRFLTGIKRAMCCLNDGAALALPAPGLSYDQLLHWLDRIHVTYLSCVPVHLHQLLREVRTDSPRLPSLRILRVSSAALPPAALNEVRRRISPNLYVNYGASEAGPMVAATPDMLAVHPDSVGRPLPGIELEIVDDLDQPVPAGTNGHVRVRGPGVLSSYLRADAQDRSRVFRNGWCYLGDIGAKNAEGLVFLKGRADEVMNFNGIMIGPGEIEAVLRRHPAVQDVAAFALPSPEHQEVPAAAIVSSQPLPTDELVRFCGERLGMRAPRMFFRVNEIPKNPAGKVLRRNLAELALAGLQKEAGAGRNIDGGGQK
jgi:acyl-coenzyme A synthetase/AMP-(fatty) acid ligase